MSDIVKSNQQNNNLTIIRFDKNVAQNGIDFNTQFGNDGQLLFDIMVYIAHTYKNNIFDYGKFEPKKFAQAMGYQLPNLLCSHPNPKQFENDKKKKREFQKLLQLGKQEVRLTGGDENAYFYTVLDNAFFCGMKYNLIFSKEYRDATGGKSKQTSVQLLREVEKHYVLDKRSNYQNKKIVYTYKVNENFENNLTNYFLNFDLHSSVIMRKKKSVYLYSFLKNLEATLIQKNANITDSLNFDMLCDLAQINIENPADAKRRLKKKIQTVFTLTDLKGKITFVKRPNDRFKYQPIIAFYKRIVEIEQPQNYLTIKDAVITRFKHSLVKYYKNNKLKEKHGTLFQYLKLVYSKGVDSPEFKPVLDVFTLSWQHVNQGKTPDSFIIFVNIKEFFKAYIISK